MFSLASTTVAPNGAAALASLFVFTSLGGARFSSAQAMLTELSPASRGTVMALNASLQQLGIVLGSLDGALALQLWGYTAIGVTASAIMAAALAIYILLVVEVAPESSAEPTPSQPELASPVGG